MLFLANNRRLILSSTLAFVALWTTSLLYRQDSSSSILSSLKDGAHTSFDFDWSSSSSTSTSADELDEEEAELPLMQGEGNMRSPLHRQFEGREFVELAERRKFGEVEILGDECLELCECLSRSIFRVEGSRGIEIVRGVWQEEEGTGGRDGG